MAPPSHNKTKMGTMSLRKLSGQEISALSASTVELKVGTWTLTTDANDALVFLFKNRGRSIGMRLDPPEGEGSLYHLLVGMSPDSFLSQLVDSHLTCGGNDAASFADYQPNSSLTKDTVSQLALKYKYSVADAHAHADNAANHGRWYDEIGSTSYQKTSSCWRGVTTDEEYFYCQGDHAKTSLMSDTVMQKYRKADGKCMWSKEAHSYFTEDDILIKKKEYEHPHTKKTYATTAEDENDLIVNSYRNLVDTNDSEGVWFRNPPVLAGSDENVDASGYVMQTSMSDNGLWLVKFNRKTGARVWAVQAFKHEMPGTDCQLGTMAPAIKQHRGKNYIFVGTGSMQNAINRSTHEVDAIYGDRGSFACVVDNDPGNMTPENDQGKLFWRTYVCPPLFRPFEAGNSEAENDLSVLRHKSYTGTPYEPGYDPFRPDTDQLNVLSSFKEGEVNVPLYGYEATGVPSEAPVEPFIASYIITPGCTVPKPFVGKSVKGAMPLMMVAGASIAVNADGVYEYQVDGAPLRFKTGEEGHEKFYSPSIENPECIEMVNGSPQMQAGKELILRYPLVPKVNVEEDPERPGFLFTKQLSTFAIQNTQGSKFSATGQLPNYVTVDVTVVGTPGGNDTYELPGEYTVQANLTGEQLLLHVPHRIPNLYYEKTVRPGYRVQSTFEAQNLNYYGNSCWGGTPVLDFDNNLVYCTSGQPHSIPEDETNALDLSTTNFFEYRMKVIEAQGLANIAEEAAKASPEDETLAQALNDAENVLVDACKVSQAEVEAAIKAGFHRKSPRGLLSHFNAVISFRMFADPDSADLEADGGIEWAGHTQNWDPWTSLSKPTGESIFTSSQLNPGVNVSEAGNLRGNDGDIGAGSTLFRDVELRDGRKRDVIAAVSKAGIAVAFDARTGETLNFDIVGPASALGGANHCCCSDGKEVIFTCIVNISDMLFGAVHPIHGVETLRWRGKTLYADSSYVNAWNVRTGKTLWNASLCSGDKTDRSFGGVSFYNGMVICNSQGKSWPVPNEPSIQVFDALTGEKIHQTEGLQTIANGGGSQAQCVTDGGLVFRHVGRTTFGMTGAPSEFGLVFAAPLPLEAAVYGEGTFNGLPLTVSVDKDTKEIKLTMDGASKATINYDEYDPKTREFSGGDIGSRKDEDGNVISDGIAAINPKLSYNSKDKTHMKVGKVYLLEGRNLPNLCLLDAKFRDGTDPTNYTEVQDLYVKVPGVDLL